MKKFIVNIAQQTGSSVGTTLRLNAWLFVNNMKVAERNNVLINDEQAALANEYDLRIQADNNAYTTEQIIEMLNTISEYKSPNVNFKETQAKLVNVANKFRVLDSNYSVNIGLTYKGIAIPQPLAEVMMNAKTEKELLAVHRFHLKCLSNTNTESVKDLFNFIQKSKLIITPSGNFVTFRRIKVVQRPVSVSLFEQISKEYNKVLFAGKDVTKVNYTVINDILIPDNEGKSIKEIHDSIMSLEGRYTDNHSRTYDYRIGKNYVEKNFDANHNNLCSRGLHSGSFDYIESMILGEQIVYCIVNPTKVVAVADNATKVRSSELYLAGIVDNWVEFKEMINAGIVNFDFEDEEFENDYEGRTIEYNQVPVSSSQGNCIYSEDELEDSYDYEDEEYDNEDEEYDEDFEEERVAFEEALEALEIAKANEARERKIQYYRDQLKKLNSNG
jgi:hypothetical protein